MMIAASAVIIIFSIFIFLFAKSFPAFSEYGLEIFSTDWSVAQQEFGLGAAVLGTIMVTVIAILIAVPLGIGSAIFLAELAPRRLREMLKPIIELLASIPSVVYGFVGVVLLVPYLAKLFNMAQGYSLLAGGMILGIMCVPIVITISDEALKSVPRSVKDASLALGATHWQTIRRITVPSAISGIFASTVLAVAKAMGETMAVLMVVGNIMRVPDPFFDLSETSATLTSLIAGQMGEASGIQVNVLFAAGVILFLIVGALSIASDLLQHRIEKKFRG